jgi:hypothetical protein
MVSGFSYFSFITALCLYQPLFCCSAVSYACPVAKMDCIALKRCGSLTAPRDGLRLARQPTVMWNADNADGTKHFVNEA